MAYTQYFGSTPVSNWTANGSKESGHDFIDQINGQQGVIDNKKGEYDTQKGQLDNSRNTYQDLFRNRQSYSDAYRNAKESEGVNDANAQYQKSLNAVNATNAAMNTLPSSINAGSNVVLNASQRNAALGNQMGQYQASLDNWTRQNAGDREAYQTALASAQNMAGQEIATQRQDIQTALQDYQNQMNYANELYNQLINERQIMRSIYGDMYEDEYRHMQNALEAWAQNLQAETERYKEGQANYRAQLSADAQRYASDAGMRFQQYMDKKALKNWDFGNGYSIQQLGNGTAGYYKNGNAISAGDFLGQTGANGVNWDLWNDVWKNGVSTQGVGSDTVNAFNRVSPASSKYNYLFGV